MNLDDKVFVAGHNGMVGGAIYRLLKERGFQNIITRTSRELDLRDSEATRVFFENERPDFVFLAAAKVGGIVANNTYRAQFLYDNLMIQSNVIHNAYLSEVKKLLFLGSTCIYPKNCPQPIREDYLLTGELEYTNEPYAIAKIAGMKMCENYNMQYGTNFLSVMPTNLFGPGDNFDLETSHVLPAMIRKFHVAKALKEENEQAIRLDLSKRMISGLSADSSYNLISSTLESFGIYKRNDHQTVVSLWGTGSPFREFLWSEDLADACVFIMNEISFENLVLPNEKVIRNKHINIGTGIEISIKSLAELIAEIVGFTGSIEFDDTKPDGTPRKLTDTSKLRSLNWRHSVELKEGIKRLYDWYLEN